MFFKGLKETALPEEAKEIADEFEQKFLDFGMDEQALKAKIDVIGSPWRMYWKSLKDTGVRQKLKDALRIMLTFRPPRESYSARIPFKSHGFPYEFVARFDVERGSKARVTFWHIDA